MRFNAIVHAPVLRDGARLNIAQADQRETGLQSHLAVGDEIHIRYGVCCPGLASGRIVSRSAQPERAILETEGRSWTLIRGADGIVTPGLVSESWFVADADDV